MTASPYGGSVYSPYGGVWSPYGYARPVSPWQSPTWVPFPVMVSPPATQTVEMQPSRLTESFERTSSAKAASDRPLDVKSELKGESKPAIETDPRKVRRQALWNALDSFLDKHPIIESQVFEQLPPERIEQLRKAENGEQVINILMETPAGKQMATHFKNRPRWMQRMYKRFLSFLPKSVLEKHFHIPPAADAAKEAVTKAVGTTVAKDALASELAKAAPAVEPIFDLAA